jgi:hypothetical protein
VTFQEWIDRLRAAGHALCPASSAVPIELRGVRPDGMGFHYRCRGVRVRLALYRPGRAAWQVPLWDDRWCPEESLSLWEQRPVEAGTPVDAADLGGMQSQTGAQLVFDDAANPDRFAVIDGAAEWGWDSHEAGLLGPAAAAVLFDRLAAEVDGQPDGAGSDLTQDAAVAEPAPVLAHTAPVPVPAMASAMASPANSAHDVDWADRTDHPNPASPADQRLPEPRLPEPPEPRFAASVPHPRGSRPLLV